MFKRYRWMTIVAAAAVCAGFGAADLPAQQEQTSYTHSRCYKAHPGKLAELREFFETTARTIGEEGVKAGKFVAYNVLEASIPRGSDNRCDFLANSRFTEYPSDVVAEHGRSAQEVAHGYRADPREARRGGLSGS